MLDSTNLAQVGYKYYNKSTGKDVERGKIVKGYKYKPGTFVIMSDADFKKANPKATQTIDIEDFIDLDAIDPVFFDKAYYLLPLKGGSKGYGLLSEALKKSGKVAVAKIVLHTKQHLCALIPRGKYLLLELLHFAEDVKELRELEEWKSELGSTKVSPKEIAMAEKLVAEMTSDWKPEKYKDTYRNDLMKRIKAKVKAGKATEITEEVADEKDTEVSSKVLDLMPLLQKSLKKGSQKAANHRHG